MPNPSMRGKVERADRQRREASKHLASVALFNVVAFKPTTKEAMRELVIPPHVEVKRIPCEGVMPREAYSVTGKRGAVRNRRCYGDGTRRWPSALVAGK